MIILVLNLNSMQNMPQWAKDDYNYYAQESILNWLPLKKEWESSILEPLRWTVTTSYGWLWFNHDTIAVYVYVKREDKFYSCLMLKINPNDADAKQGLDKAKQARGR